MKGTYHPATGTMYGGSHGSEYFREAFRRLTTTSEHQGDLLKKKKKNSSNIEKGTFMDGSSNIQTKEKSTRDISLLLLEHKHLF